MDSRSQAEQTSLPPESMGEAPDICAWCGKPSANELVLEPDRFKYVHGKEGKKVKVLRKRAIVVKVCKFHWQNLQRVKNG